jgi:hypothetical protein
MPLTRYRYRIDVGDEYAYCDSGWDLDNVIRSLLDDVSIGSLAAPSTKRATIREIQITLEPAPRPEAASIWSKTQG